MMGFWKQRSTRERFLLILLLSITVACAAYQGLWPAWQQQQHTLQSKIQQQALKWHWLQQHAYVPAMPSNHTVQHTAESIEKSIKHRYPQAEPTLEAKGEHLHINIASIPYPAMVQLLAQWRTQGFKIRALTIEHSDKGTVTSRVSLQTSTH